MNLINLSKARDTSWKVIAAIFIVVIIVFVLIGLIGALVKFIMDKQSRAVDKDMSKLVVSRTIDNPKEFKRVANIKSQIRFLKASSVPLSILLAALLTWLIYHLIYINSDLHPWNESIFNYETGILSLFYIPDLSTIKYTPPFGFDNSEFKWLYEAKPFTDEKITNYVIFILLLVGVIYYLVCVQAYAARKRRINKLSKSIYSQNLETMDLEKFYNSGMKLKSDETNKE